MEETGRSPSSRELRIFSALWLVFFCLLGLLSWRGGSPRVAMSLVAAGGIVGLAGLARPPLVRAIFVVWTGVTYPIGLFITRLLMSAMFYLVVTPVGLLQRLLGADAMTRQIDRSAPSYWQERGRPSGPAGYLRQY